MMLRQANADTVNAGSVEQSSGTGKVNRMSRAVRNENILGLAMAIGPVVGFILFGLIPIAISVFLSFTKVHRWDMADMQFNGLKNYWWLLKDPGFYQAILNTLYYTTNVFIGLILSLVIAVLMSKIVRLNKMFAIIFFIPYICSIVAVSNMWKWMFEANYGIINHFLKRIGLQPVRWLQNSKTFMLCIIMMTVWSSIGFNVILLQSAIANVDKSYYESAELDGANGFQQFWKITMPGISPTLFYIIVMGVISSLQAFTPMQVMTDGLSYGPDNSGMTVVYYLYRMSFDFRPSMGIGLASSLACMLAVVIGAITYLNFKLSGKWVRYDD